MIRDHHRLLLIVTGVLVLALAVAAYWPGLAGGFLFDDLANLPALGAYGPIDNWPAFWRYITSGTADPLGRPLALLTFLVDARDWPADPFRFKRTALILHLVNGALSYALLYRLGQALAINMARCRTAALAGAALWLLHPLFVSTTLYIIQRESMLPATAVLSGLLIWLYGREQLRLGRVTSGTAWSVLGLGGFTLLAALAKANGALLPFYALLVELIILAPRRPIPKGTPRRTHHMVLAIFVVLPSLAIVTYLLYTGIQGIVTGDTGVRPWTIAQRLLTEPRVLIDYLALLWLPRPFSTGLFNDQYVASSSLLQPLTTLLALLTVSGLIGGAWLVRRRQPALALAVLFYFAGHLVESTSVPLELYFEHRNYIPALLMFWPLAIWLTQTEGLRPLKYALLITLPLGLASMTYARTQVWGNVRTQDMLWARINPHSPRAQANAALFEMQSGHAHDAARRLERLLALQPDQVQLAFNLLTARCLSGGVSTRDLDLAGAAMEQTRNTGTFIARWFGDTLPLVNGGKCQGLTIVDLLTLIDTGLQNDQLSAPAPQQDLLYIRAKIRLMQHEPALALADFTRAIDRQVRPAIALQSAATLGSAGYPSQGLTLLQHYEKVRQNVDPPQFGMPMVHELVLRRQGYWAHELSHLRMQLVSDISASRSTHISVNAPKFSVR